MNRFPKIRSAFFLLLLLALPAWSQTQETGTLSPDQQELRIAQLERQVTLERQALWQILLPFSIILWGGIAAYLWFLHSKQRKVQRDIVTIREELERTSGDRVRKE